MTGAPRIVVWSRHSHLEHGPAEPAEFAAIDARLQWEADAQFRAALLVPISQHLAGEIE